MTTYPPVAEFKFWAGPYEAPKVRVGTTLHDEWLGDVRVDGFTETPIPWPGTTLNKGRHKGLIPILCDSLVRAVCEEEQLAVRHYWGVTQYIVDEWKKALAGETDSRRVFTVLALKRRDPQFRKKFYPSDR